MSARRTLRCRRWHGDEGGRGFIHGDIIDVNLFKEEKSVSLIERQEGALHF
jgi:hypothetical protein